jgi:hypothetical protein
MRLVDHDRCELRGRRLVLERRGDVQSREPDHGSVRFRDDDAVAGGLHPREAPRYRAGVRGIAELAQEIRDRRGILLSCVPDRRLHEV